MLQKSKIEERGKFYLQIFSIISIVFIGKIFMPDF